MKLNLIQKTMKRLLQMCRKNNSICRISNFDILKLIFDCPVDKLSSQQVHTHKMSPKILIIGTGASGIAAATRLYENGVHDFVMLEAENRIGGRVHTIPYGKNVLDLGGQWCHGEDGNVVFGLANPLNALAPSKFDYRNFEYHRSNGTVLDKAVGDKITALIFEVQSNYDVELKLSNESLGKFIIDKVEHIVATNSEYRDIQHNLVQDVISVFQKFQDSLDGSDSWFDSAARGYTEYWECGGNMLLNWKGRGYTTILDILLKRFPDPSTELPIINKIQFNKTVKQINWNGECSPHQQVEVVCEDGTTYYADHVLCTVSLGVLKERHEQLFNPSLPLLKQTAIRTLGFGTVDKIYVEFAEPFWPKNWFGFNMLWEKVDLDAALEQPNNWITEVFGFYPVDDQPNILCGWIVGPKARAMETRSIEEIKDGVLYLLRKFITTWTIPEPVNIKTTDWYANRNFRGAYGGRTMASQTLYANNSHIAYPLSNSTGAPVLLFAGEATHDHYFSTVHGAVESGWREAARLTEIVKHSRQPVNPEYCDILILGGGLAGLGAAYKLKNSTQTSKILEGANRCGGRVFTTKMSAFKNQSDHNNNHEANAADEDDYVESGAQWLHGINNELYRIARENQFLTDTISDEGGGDYIREDGYRFDSFFVSKIDFIVGQMLTDCTTVERDGDYATIDQFLKTKFTSYLMNSHTNSNNNNSSTFTFTDAELKLAHQLLDWHYRFQIIDNSCLSLAQLSCKTWGDYYCDTNETEQNHINFRLGFGAVIKYLTDSIGDANIKLNSRVTNINYRNNKFVIRTIEPGGKMGVYESRYIFITFSMGVLKDYVNLFDSNMLPPLKQYIQIIDNYGFNAIDKILLKFSTKWWPNDEGIQLVWTDETSYKTEKWTRYISGFDAVTHGPTNTLLGWIGGIGCIEMEKLSDHDIIRDCIELLKRFTKLDVPYPEKYYISRWHSNSLVKGAYSYPTVDFDKLNINRDNLNIPLTVNDLNQTSFNDRENMAPVLFFAGEACHKTFFSTAHGAFLSGADQASKLLNYFK